MHKDWNKIANDLTTLMREAATGIPDTWTPFNQAIRAAQKDGALTARTKELIAIGIAIAGRCDGCIAFHVRSAVKLGATREELLETIGVALYMGGGPSSVYGAQALEAFDQFSAAD